MCKKGNDRNGTKHEDTRSIMPVRRLSASSTSAMTTSTSSLILDDTDAERSALRLVAITTEKANGGDPLAMLDLSNWHYHGQKGLPVSYEASYRWTKKASMLDCASAMADQGYMLYNGQGTVTNRVEASCLLANAASLGSRKAAAYLGALYFLGKERGGFPRCFNRAKYWLERSLTSHQSLVSDEDFDVEKAKDLLESVEDALMKL